MSVKTDEAGYAVVNEGSQNNENEQRKLKEAIEFLTKKKCLPKELHYLQLCDSTKEGNYHLPNANEYDEESPYENEPVYEEIDVVKSRINEGDYEDPEDVKSNIRKGENLYQNRPGNLTYENLRPIPKTSIIFPPRKTESSTEEGNLPTPSAIKNTSTGNRGPLPPIPTTTVETTVTKGGKKKNITISRRQRQRKTIKKGKKNGKLLGRHKRTKRRR